VLAERGLGTDSGGRRSASTALRRADSILYGNTMGEFSHSLAEACLSSAPILGERIDKGVLKRRIDKLEEQLEDVALLSELGDEVAFIMEQVAKKVIYMHIYIYIEEDVHSNYLMVHIRPHHNICRWTRRTSRR
jgi:hypothetical protein